MGQTADLVSFAAGLRYSDLPDEVVARAKDLFVNSWGVQLAASTLHWSKTVYRFWRNQGGTPQSTVASYGDVDQKFRALARVVLDEQATEDLLETARTIENVRDMSLVASQLAGPGRRPGPGRVA